MKTLIVIFVLYVASVFAQDEYKSVSFMAGDIIQVTWEANAPEDSVQHYTVYANGWSGKTTATEMRFENLTQTTEFYVTATNCLRINDYVEVESDPSEKVIAYFVEAGQEVRVFGVEELSRYISKPGTYSPNRLGIWDGMWLDVPLNLPVAGTYRIEVFTSGKSGRPVINFNGEPHISIPTGWPVALHRSTIRLDAGPQTLKLSVTGGDLWVWDKYALTISLIKKDLIAPGRVIGIDIQKM